MYMHRRLVFLYNAASPAIGLASITAFLIISVDLCEQGHHRVNIHLDSLIVNIKKYNITNFNKFTVNTDTA